MLLARRLCVTRGAVCVCLSALGGAGTWPFQEPFRAPSPHPDPAGFVFPAPAPKAGRSSPGGAAPRSGLGVSVCGCRGRGHLRGCFCTRGASAPPPAGRHRCPRAFLLRCPQFLSLRGKPRLCPGKVRAEAAAAAAPAPLGSGAENSPQAPPIGHRGELSLRAPRLRLRAHPAPLRSRVPIHPTIQPSILPPSAAFPRLPRGAAPPTHCLAGSCALRSFISSTVGFAFLVFYFFLSFSRPKVGRALEVFCPVEKTRSMWVTLQTPPELALLLPTTTGICCSPKVATGVSKAQLLITYTD